MTLVQHFTSYTPAMVEDLEWLVRHESPSHDRGALTASAGAVADIGRRLLGAEPEVVSAGDAVHVRWRFGSAVPKLLLLGHHDTVWPLGTIDRIPWSVVDGRACGPGCLDMKAGLVIMLHALAAQHDLDGVTVLVSGDEEVGSPGASELIDEEVRGAVAALVAEPSASGGALKTARSGVSQYELLVHGRAAHAGLEPHRGRNASVEAAHQLLRVVELATRLKDVTVVPTMVSGGIAANTVPAKARVVLDARPQTLAAERRLEELFGSLSPHILGTSLKWRRRLHVPPMEASMTEDLFQVAAGLAQRHGLPPVTAARVGGGSDGNRTAAAGVPTLDGLGAVGDGAHADHEYVDVGRLAERTALLAALVGALRTTPRETWQTRPAVDVPTDEA